MAQLCSERYSTTRREYFNETDLNIRCANVYKDKFLELVESLHEFPAEKKVFRTTTAGTCRVRFDAFWWDIASIESHYALSVYRNKGWLKYGNYGFAWPIKFQPFSLSSDFVSHFNEIAIQVLQTSTYDDFSIMDGFWISLARPENTEIQEDNFIGPHLVHPGEEVIAAMAKQFSMLVLQHSCHLVA